MQKKAEDFHSLSCEGLTLLSSALPSTKFLVQEAVRILHEIEKTIILILEQMQSLAEFLREYQVAVAMPGIGKTLAVRLIAEVGDVRRFRNANALVAFAGLNSPPHQSGAFHAVKRRISKRGSPSLRKTGFEIINSIRKTKPTFDNAVFLFMSRKEAEGKPAKGAKIAGMNKFFRIYNARVKEVYSL